MRSSPATPDPQRDRGTLVFLHVPKTAGTTLAWILRRQYSPERIIAIEPDHMLAKYRDFRAMPESARRDLQCVIGHVPYGIHRWLPQGACYITMLRNPIDWTLSFYEYIQRKAFFDHDPDLVAFRAGRGLTLDEFVRFLEESHMADLQTRMIAGQVNPETLLPPYAPLSESALEDAVRNLRVNCLQVGIVERFDESLLLMRRKLGWGRVYYRPLNVGEKTAASKMPPPEIRERILACNRRDVALYDEACRLVASDIESAGKAFQAEWHSFRRNNALYGRLLPVYEATGLGRIRRALQRAPGGIR